MTIELRTSKLHGRGVFALRRFERGELIERAPVLVIPAAQLADLDRTMLYDYYFGWGEDAALAMGYGSFYNHAVEANADHVSKLGELAIDIVARLSIEPGDEITIHYDGAPGDPTPVWFERPR